LIRTINVIEENTQVFCIENCLVFRVYSYSTLHCSMKKVIITRNKRIILALWIMIAEICI